MKGKAPPSSQGESTTDENHEWTASVATPPTRVVLEPFADPVFIPAGHGCAFDVIELRDDPKFHGTITSFDDGRILRQGHGIPTLVNVETGTSLDHDSDYVAVETFDPTSLTVDIEINGRIFMNFWPGDEGPWGTVEYPGLMLSVTGHQSGVYDISEERITSYELQGKASDLCGPLAAELEDGS